MDTQQQRDNDANGLLVGLLFICPPLFLVFLAFWLIMGISRLVFGDGRHYGP